MKPINFLKLFVISTTVLSFLAGCKKNETYKPIPNAIYIVSNAITGPGTTASSAVTNSASGKVSISPAVGRIYVNIPQTFDITVNYTLSGTAVAGTNYTPPANMSVTVPAGKWSADIDIPVINTPLVGGNKTIIITLTTATNNTQVGIGSDRNYKTFAFTLTN